jgi:hypothetical protein
MSRFHRFYTFISKQKACVYCGARATSKDHFVPISVVSLIADALDYVSGKVLVPCCGECNSLAGDHVFPTIAAKRRFIHVKLRKRHKRLLEMPQWTDAQLDEMGYALSDFIRSGLERKQWLIERLAWRNTSNAEPVKLAAVRSPFIGSGHVSVAQNAVRSGTMSTAKNSKRLGKNG